MKKRMSYFLYTILLFMCFTNVHAALYGVVNTDVLRVRSGPGTNYDIVANLTIGQTSDLATTTHFADESGCSGQDWYQITYSGNKTGYVCSLYFDVYERGASSDNKTATTACEQELASKGFPSSYWSGLCALKNNHPNWNFEKINTDVDFNAAVSAESSCGKNVMSTSNSNYINTNCSRTDYSGYKTISSGVVAYYLDPRNFFNDTNIFMFESQYYNNNINDDSYRETTSKIYNGNFIITQIPSLPNYILQAGKSTGMSPVAITSRIYQELGNGKLTSGQYSGQLYSAISGNYTSRYPGKVATDGHSLDNYYNFYNINAFDSSGDITYDALKYAYSQNWGGTGNSDTDRQTAITGGANWIKNRYLDAGQKTAYLQKFNVNPNVKTSLYMNQYMTNVVAPKSESSTIYKAYSNLNMLNAAFTFYIPVFENMPSVTNLPTSSNDKNYNGTGSIVSSDSGSNNSIASDSNVASVSSIIAGAGLSTSGNYITKINPGTDVATIKAAVENMGGSVTIQNNSGKTVNSGTIGTGFKIIFSGNTTYTAVIYGDISGDGKINSLDLLKAQKHILKSSILSGSNVTAADASKDGKVNSLDLLKIQKDILGSAKIAQ